VYARPEDTTCWKIPYKNIIFCRAFTVGCLFDIVVITTVCCLFVAELFRFIQILLVGPCIESDMLQLLFVCIKIVRKSCIYVGGYILELICTWNFNNLVEPPYEVWLFSNGLLKLIDNTYWICRQKQHSILLDKGEFSTFRPKILQALLESFK